MAWGAVACELRSPDLQANISYVFPTTGPVACGVVRLVGSAVQRLALRTSTPSTFFPVRQRRWPIN